MVVESSVKIVGEFPQFPQSAVRSEVSQARVSLAEAVEGGPIHRRFVEVLPEPWKRDPSVEIFSRVLWLKDGWFPLAPHYHLDWDLGVNGPRVETLMALVGDASQTEFVSGPVAYQATGERQSRMNRWAAEIEEGLRSGKLATWTLEPGKLILLDNRTLHRARPARKTGWRLLMRAIRGLGKNREGEPGAGYGNPGRFTTCRNGYIPVTDDEKLRFEPYRS